VAAGFPTTVAPIVQNRLVPVFLKVLVFAVINHTIFATSHI